MGGPLLGGSKQIFPCMIEDVDPWDPGANLRIEYVHSTLKGTTASPAPSKWT